jgi:transketolase
VLVSDGECNEGQVWEAAMFAAHHSLANLTVVVDINGLQALGPTKDVLDLRPLGDKWRAFGWQCQEVDGHDLAALLQVLATPTIKPGGRPRVVLAHTVLGKGISFMENRFEWHYRPLSDRLFAAAIAEIEAAG